jgi:hypothetical protein
MAASLDPRSEIEKLFAFLSDKEHSRARHLRIYLGVAETLKSPLPALEF